MSGAVLDPVNKVLRDLGNDLANWTTEERAEAIETLGDLAIVAGTRGHEMHRRVGELLVRLRELTRAVDTAMDHYTKEAQHGRP